jgi:thiol-disulfide isomerase/thioredoxin
MARTPSTMPALGTALEKLPLQYPDGTLFRWNTVENKPVLVAFLCNHCPFVLHVIDVFSRIANDFHPEIFVLAVNANDIEQYPQDGPVYMKELANQKNWKFPFLLDASQEFAKRIGAACTPDFFLYDSHHKLVYRGQMDASRPGNGIPPTGEALLKAADALRNGLPIPEPQIPSLGCNIKWKPGNEPSYFSH